MGDEQLLDRIDSISLKLGLVGFAAALMTLVVNELGINWDVPVPLRLAAAVLLSLMMVQVLARGLTAPVLELADAARDMARGNYGRRVKVTSNDEIGELGRSFNRMAAELAESDRLRRDLVANVSHELRTPISALQARLENLVDGVEQPDNEVLGAMLSQVQRLGRLVTQLLDLSRLEAGTVPLDRRRFVVRSLLDEVAREALLHDPNALVEVSATTGLEVDGDPERLHQVVANLLGNALRHATAGPAGPPLRPVRARERGHRGARHRPGHPARAGRAGLRPLLPRRLRPVRQRRWCRPRPGHRPVDRRAARRHHHGRAQRAPRRPHDRDAPGPRLSRSERS